MTPMSQSSFSGGSIKSSLRKTKNKAKKTRFADVRDSRSSRGGRSSRQESYTPLSQSSSNSQGSQGTSRSRGRRIQLQRPSAAMHATNGHRSSHSGHASDFLPPRQQHATTENPNAPRNDSKHQRRLSAIAGLQEQMFSRISTPLKPVNIPYPPIKFQPRNKRQSLVQPTKRKDELYGNENDPNTAMSNSRKDSDQDGNPYEEKCDGATKRGNDAQELCSNEDRESSKEYTVTNAGAAEDGSSSAASASTNSNSSSKIAVGSRMGSSDEENERMETFKDNLEKLLSEAKAAVHEELKAKLDEGVTAIQEASKSNLDKIGQKRDEAEKAIETLHESTKKQLEEAACASLQKVEACTETSLSKLKKFTETWLSTSYNTIANRFKPYLASPTEIEAENIQNDSIGFRTPIVQERRGTSDSGLGSTGKNRLKRKAVAPLDDSSKTDHAEKCSSSGEGGRIPAQHSVRTAQRDSLGETSTQPLRRSKRMKERKERKCEDNTSENTTSTTTVPRADKQQKTRLSTATSNAKMKLAKQSKTSLPLKMVKSAKTLCVTPTEATSRSLKKKRTKPTSTGGSKKSQSEINKLKPLRSKRRKRHKTPSPLSKKRSKPSRQSSQRSIPSEVELTFNDVQLSPLEGPNLYSFPSTKPTPKSFQPFERKKRTPPRTYGRKKKAFFDVLDNTGVFCF